MSNMEPVVIVNLPWQILCHLIDIICRVQIGGVRAQVQRHGGCTGLYKRLGRERDMLLVFGITIVANSLLTFLFIVEQVV